MKGFPTTFLAMFDRANEGRPSIAEIEIPIIQRDYAQGREDADTAAIRRDFLDVLMRALTTTESVGLDFVYGEVKETLDEYGRRRGVAEHGGILKPLDGQQRLTTLFLLHWYVASRAGALKQTARWTRFRYATRLNAEHFCHELVSKAWPQNGSKPVDWITDQPWYLFPWRTDPTIKSMLVMIASIHDRLSQDVHDFGALWKRLTDSEAISFLFLPIEDMESGDDLYIKMNSRGKPLTEFEVFKARLEKALKASGRHKELSEKFDREWSDLLWHYEGGDFSIDEEFLNYLGFIIDVCDWRAGSARSDKSLLERAEHLFAHHEDADLHLAFLFFAFDTWVGDKPSDNKPAQAFSELFSVEGGNGSGLLHFESQDPNLFEACLEHYGSNQFSLDEALLLYAVITFRQFCPGEPVEVLTQRLRSLRNIAESAPDEVRSEYMPELIASTTKLMTDMTDGYLDGLKRFNQARIDDERLKRALVQEHPAVEPAVHALEDHHLLRGRLFAFELDPVTLGAQSETFWTVATDEVLPHLASALLTKGDYSRRLGARRQFGVPGQLRGGGSWRDVLTGGSREGRSVMRAAVNELLLDVASRNGQPQDILSEIVSEWLSGQDASARFDWRYYFVKYPSMLEAGQGMYYVSGDETSELGYKLHMLKGRDYRSAFSDPYLYAIWTEVGMPGEVGKPDFRSWDYTGTEQAMKLRRSGIGIRSLDVGFEILLPEESVQADAGKTALSPFDLGAENVIHVKKGGPDGNQVDAEDRVQLGVKIVQSLLEAGL